MAKHVRHQLMCTLDAHRSPTSNSMSMPRLSGCQTHVLPAQVQTGIVAGLQMLLHSLCSAPDTQRSQTKACRAKLRSTGAELLLPVRITCAYVL